MAPATLKPEKARLMPKDKTERDGDVATAMRFLSIAARGHPDPASRETAARELARLS